jgi:hypothetical protein
VFVADGDVWAGCSKVGEGFSCTGDVHLFQAENWLIFQCRETDTFWWDGVAGLVRSPGMNEQDWNDPETPVQEISTEAPVADIPGCDLPGDQSGIVVTFTVLDATTELPLASTIWEVKRNGNIAHKGLGDENGQFVFHPVPRTYTYDIRKAGYLPLENVELVINGVGEAYHFEDCYPPVEVIKGNIFVTARMVPQEEVCDLVLTDIIVGPSNSRVVLNAVNNGTVAVTVTAITVGELEVASIVPALPVTIPVGVEVTFAVETDGSLEEETIDFVTGCGSFSEEIPTVIVPECSFDVSSELIGGGGLTDSASVLITNTGEIPVELEFTVGFDELIEFEISPSIPFTLGIGISQAFTITTTGSDIRGVNYYIQNSCGEDVSEAFPTE